MAQLKIDIEKMKSGRIAVELSTGLCKERPMIEAEAQIAYKIKGILAIVITDIANMTPGSSLAVGEADVETLKGLESLDFKKGENEKYK